MPAAAGWAEKKGQNPGAFVWAPVAPNVLALAYYFLAVEIVNRKELAECPECHRIFPIHHGRQRFCSPMCANRSRYRRHTDKHRRKAEGAA